MSNRLANETSPYLLQHAQNPVDWFPWGPEALERARCEDRPILLSIGYSACHWCHVMARESFEDDEIAGLMNSLFVNVKVDREERPDLDAIYMQAVQAMTGHGGWPMTVFLTPQGEPFYGGTYFPPEDRHGTPGFHRVLRSIGDAWASNRDDVARAARSMNDVYVAASAPTLVGTPMTRETLDAAYHTLQRRFDPSGGGFGGAPKFPHAMSLDFLLRRWARTGEAEALQMVEYTFRKMSRGGMYDHVGGGFARYSVDAEWQVPHFEKMLYDNALLARLGTHLWQATHDPEVERVTRETLRWVTREMTDPSGGFYSSLDADSEHEEGKFYLWTLDEVRQLLGNDADAVISHFGMTAAGNFERKNVLHLGMESRAEAATVERAKAALYAARARRVRPACDDKMLASWNGLMLRAVADGARAFGDAALRAAALANGAFLARELVHDDRVYRTHRNGQTRIRGFLEDHAAVGLGFVALYQMTFDRTWLDRARGLADSTVRQFWSDEAGAFFDTALDHETLVTRPREVADNATPSGTSLAAELLLTIAEFTGDLTLRRRAERVLSSLARLVARHAPEFGHLLGVADMAVFGAVELAIAGDSGAMDFAALAGAAAREYVPSLVMAGGTGEEVRGLPLLEGRSPVDGHATAWVCRDYACELPAADPAELAGQLRGARRPATA